MVSGGSKFRRHLLWDRYNNRGPKAFCTVDLHLVITLINIVKTLADIINSYVGLFILINAVILLHDLGKAFRGDSLSVVTDLDDQILDRKSVV